MHPLTDAFIQGRVKFKKKEVAHYFELKKAPKAACHFGAMYWGVYKSIEWQPLRLVEDFPELKKIVPVPCEETLEPDGEIRSILIHLSDEHDGRSGWTDEKVAQWLEKSLTS